LRAALEVAAGLVLLALEGLPVLADHGHGLGQLVVDVLELIDHPIARLRREVLALVVRARTVVRDGSWHRASDWSGAFGVTAHGAEPLAGLWCNRI
jgi:hypothetical protein